MRDTEAGDAAPPSTAGTMSYILIGPILWAAHLTVLYFSHSMLCAHGLADLTIAGIDVVSLVIVVATAVALALLAAAVKAPTALARLLRASAGIPSEQAFRRRAMAGLALLSAAGVAWAGFAAFVLPTCAELR